MSSRLCLFALVVEGGQHRAVPAALARASTELATGSLIHPVVHPVQGPTLGHLCMENAYGEGPRPSCHQGRPSPPRTRGRRGWEFCTSNQDHCQFSWGSCSSRPPPIQTNAPLFLYLCVRLISISILSQLGSLFDDFVLTKANCHIR